MSCPDNGGGGGGMGQKSKKWVTSFMDSPTWKIKHSKRGKKHISENVVGTLVIEKIAGKELTSKCFKSIWDWLPLLILFFSENCYTMFVADAFVLMLIFLQRKPLLAKLRLHIS